MRCMPNRKYLSLSHGSEFLVLRGKKVNNADLSGALKNIDTVLGSPQEKIHLFGSQYE